MGLQRIYSALQAHMWPGLILKRDLREENNGVTDKGTAEQANASHGQYINDTPPSIDTSNEEQKSEEEVMHERESALYQMLPPEPEDEGDELSEQADAMDK